MASAALGLGLLFLTVEFAVVAIVIAYLALRRNRRTETAAVADVTALVGKVELGADTRRGALATVLRETYQFDAEEADKVVADFIERERAFYNALIGVHLGRGGKTLADVPAEFTKVVAPWLRIAPKHMISAASLATLTNEHSQLSGELAGTRKVLEALMAEYNAAFFKGQKPDPARVPSTAPATTQGLLSIDGDGSAPLAAEDDAVVTSNTVWDEDPPQSTALAFAATSSEIIELDLDDMGGEPAPPAPGPLTPHDLDALMENLDADLGKEPAPA